VGAVPWWHTPSTAAPEVSSKEKSLSMSFELVLWQEVNPGPSFRCIITGTHHSAFDKPVEPHWCWWTCGDKVMQLWLGLEPGILWPWASEVTE
jgi:hypothetical protein